MEICGNMSVKVRGPPVWSASVRGSGGAGSPDEGNDEVRHMRDEG